MAKRRIVLKDYIASLEEQGTEVEHEGQVFVIPPPQLWPDEVNGTVGVVGQAKAIMGEEQYARLVAAGGTARMVNEWVEQMIGASSGE